MKINRAPEERESEPRQRPLSADLGEIVAGMAATGPGGCVSAADLRELELLRQHYANPVM